MQPIHFRHKRGHGSLKLEPALVLPLPHKDAVVAAA
jgi:hypothetical protein